MGRLKPATAHTSCKYTSCTSTLTTIDCRIYLSESVRGGTYGYLFLFNLSEALFSEPRRMIWRVGRSVVRLGHGSDCDHRDDESTRHQATQGGAVKTTRTQHAKCVGARRRSV